MLCSCGAARVVDPAPDLDLDVGDDVAKLDFADLDCLIADAVARAYLQAFAHEQMCEESINCIVTLRHLRASGEYSLTAAKSFADEFLRTSKMKCAASYVEDVPEQLRRSLLNALDVSQNKLSAHAKALIFQTNTVVSNFIKSDILIRFRNSRHYQEMLLVHPLRALHSRKVAEAFARSLNDPFQKSAIEVLLSTNETRKQEVLKSLGSAYLTFMRSSEGKKLVHLLIGTTQSCLEKHELDQKLRATSSAHLDIERDQQNEDSEYDYTQGW